MCSAIVIYGYNHCHFIVILLSFYCVLGHYCETTGLTDTTDPCSAGYYCIRSSSTPTPTDGGTGDICTAGHYCPLGTSDPIPCPEGTYSSGTGMLISLHTNMVFALFSLIEDRENIFYLHLLYFYSSLLKMNVISIPKIHD